jgi:hypothetical protein
MLVHGKTRKPTAAGASASYGKTCTWCGTFYSEASARFLYSDGRLLPVRRTLAGVGRARGREALPPAHP